MRLPIPSDHAPVPLSEYYPELPVPIRELLLYFARHGRDSMPECAADRMLPLHELPPAVVTAKLQLTEIKHRNVQRSPGREYPPRFPIHYQTG